MIAAVLIMGINSDLPGLIVAQVSRTDQRYQARTATPGQRDPDRDLLECETSAAACDPDIAGERHLASATEAVPIDGGYYRTGRRLRGPSTRHLRRHQGRHVMRGQLLQFLLGSPPEMNGPVAGRRSTSSAGADEPSR